MDQYKAFNIRIKHELWVFLKKLSVEKDTSMGKILEEMLQKMKSKNDKKSIDNNAN